MLLDGTFRPKLSRCLCCVLQVGKTPRSGLFGTCFDPNSNGQQLLSARKGRRLWVADAHSGQVLSTIKCVSTISVARYLLASTEEKHDGYACEAIKSQQCTFICNVSACMYSMCSVSGTRELSFSFTFTSVMLHHHLKSP